MNSVHLRVLHALLKPRVFLSSNAFPIRSALACAGVLEQGAADQTDRLPLARCVLKQAMPDLPSTQWMALAKASPLNSTLSFSPDDPTRSLLLKKEDYLGGGQAAAEARA